MQIRFPYVSEPDYDQSIWNACKNRKAIQEKKVRRRLLAAYAGTSMNRTWIMYAFQWRFSLGEGKRKELVGSLQ